MAAPAILTESESKPLKPLTPKEDAFIEAYVGPARFNGAEAARMVGYSEKTAKEIACAVLTKVHIKAEIQKRLQERRLGTDDLTHLLKGFATGSMVDFLTVQDFDADDPDNKSACGTSDGWKIDLLKAKREGKLHLIKSITQQKHGGIKLELHDPQAAIDKLLKVQGAYTENKVISGPNGGPIEVVNHPVTDLMSHATELRQACRQVEQRERIKLLGEHESIDETLEMPPICML